MINDLLVFKVLNLSIFAVLVYLASFAVPTGALVSILSFSSVAVGWGEIMTVFFIVLTAAIAGDISTYFFAKLFSVKAKKIIASHGRLEYAEKKVGKFFIKNGFITIILSRFLLTSMGPVVNYYSGFSHYDVKKFIAATVLGELVYAGMYTAIGFVFKGFISDILDFINGALWVMVTLVAIIFVIKKIKKELKKK